MKKIIQLIILLIFSNGIFAQDENFEKHLRQELKAETKLSAKEIEEIVLKRMNSLKSARIINNSLSSNNMLEAPLLASPCVNSGFENSSDFSNYAAFGWAGFGANTFNTTGYVANSITSGLLAGSVVNGFQNQTAYSTLGGFQFGGSYHAIVSAGTDANIAALPRSISGNSLRLGNDNPNNGAEIISKTFIVPAGMNKFRFQYATVCVPDGFGRPGFFSAKAVDASGVIVDELSDIGVSTNPMFQYVSGFYYRPWHIAELDVSSLIGQQVTIIIINTDCFISGHKQYVYVDDFCTTQDDIQEGFIKVNTIDSCQKFPFTLNGTFGLPNIAGNPAQNVTITLKFYQSGVLVGSKVIPSPVAPNYSITIAQSDLPNVSGCIDVVAELSFKIKDMNNNLQTVVKTSGNPNSGFRAGQNNDICFNCCSCSQSPHPYLFWLTGSGDAVIDNQLDLTCGGKYTDKLSCYQRYTIKVQNPCGDNCQPDEVITSINYIPASGSGLTGYTLTGNILTANLPGTYEITIKVKCGGKWCADCKITFIQTKKCEPPCDNCKVNGKDKVHAAFNPANPPTSYVVQTYPNATTLTAGFVLDGGTDTYTQVRANVVDVQVSSDNPACLQCYNTPNQWGSISNGNLPGFNRSVTTYPAVSPGNANNNPREIVFNSASPVSIHAMTALSLNMKIPGVSTVSCCCIHVTIFVKITFRNNKCEECTKIIKIELDQCPGKGDQGKGTITFITNKQIQLRQHAPSKEDEQLMNDIKINKK